MKRLTETDRGTFLVETQGSMHKWEITDESVSVTRFSSRHNPFGCDALNGTPYLADVRKWPEVGEVFFNVINGAGGDVPWTQSSTVKNISRVEA